MDSFIDREVKNCYNHICKYWKEENYKTLKKEWNDIKNKICHNGVVCKKCNTNWENKKYILTNYILENNKEKRVINCCPNCDTFLQPYLCNPLNEKYVLEYIPIQYHKYILTVMDKDHTIQNSEDF